MISKNHAATGGGGIYNGNGGVTIYQSTVDGNVTDGDGGGLLNQDFMAVEYSTFSNNSTNSFWGGNGGGISSNSASAAGGVSNSTIAYNSAKNVGGLFNAGYLSVINSTIAQNTDGLTVGGLGSQSRCQPGPAEYTGGQ